MDPDASDNEIDLSVKRTLDNMKNGDSDFMNNKSEVSESESSPGEERSDASPSGVWMSGDEDKGKLNVPVDDRLGPIVDHMSATEIECFCHVTYFLINWSIIGVPYLLYLFPFPNSMSV